MKKRDPKRSKKLRNFIVKDIQKGKKLRNDSDTFKNSLDGENQNSKKLRKNSDKSIVVQNSRSKKLRNRSKKLRNSKKTTIKDDKPKKSARKVKIREKSLFFYLTVIEAISKDGKVSTLGKSKQAMNYYINRLKKADIVYSKGYGTYGINQTKYDKMSHLMKNGNLEQVKILLDGTTSSYINQSVSKNIRGHGFQFKLIIPRKILNWNSRTKYMDSKLIPYISIKQGQSINIEGHTVWLCNDSLIVYFSYDSCYYGETAIQGRSGAIYDFKKIIKKIENAFSINLKKQGNYIFSIDKQHFGKIDDELAKKCNNDGIKLKAIGNDGKTWLLVDKSLNLDELETVHPKSSHEDMDKVILPWLNGSKKMYDDSGEPVTPQLILRLIELNARNSGQNTQLINNILTRESYQSGIDPTDTNPDKPLSKKRPDYVG